MLLALYMCACACVFGTTGAQAFFLFYFSKKHKESGARRALFLASDLLSFGEGREEGV